MVALERPRAHTVGRWTLVGGWAVGGLRQGFLGVSRRQEPGPGGTPGSGHRTQGSSTKAGPRGHPVPRAQGTQRQAHVGTQFPERRKVGTWPREQVSQGCPALSTGGLSTDQPSVHREPPGRGSWQEGPRGAAQLQWWGEEGLGGVPRWPLQG